MTSEPDNRTNALLSLAATLPKVTRRTLGRHGLAEGGLVTDWRSVVGEMIAERSVPLRLSFSGDERRDGTLHVRVAGALALELQHLEPQVLARINGYFGYRAVARLKIHQGPIPMAAKTRRPPPIPPSPAAEAGVGEMVAAVEDEGLRSALHRLGCSLHQKPHGAKS